MFPGYVVPWFCLVISVMLGLKREGEHAFSGIRLKSVRRTTSEILNEIEVTVGREKASQEME